MRKKIFTTVTILIAACSARATVFFNDGGQHSIDYVIDDGVVVDYDTPMMGTQVELISGGWIKSTLAGYEDSQLSIWGGKAEGVRAWGRTEVGIYGGTIDSMIAHNYSVIEMNAGEVIRDFHISDNSKAMISGGVFRMGIEASSSSEVTISGGEISGVFCLLNSGLIILDGSSFVINGESIGYGDLASDYAIAATDPWGYPCLTGTVTGLLANGDMLSNSFVIYDDGDITFVPEPGTVVLLLLGGLLLRRRKWEIRLTEEERNGR